MNVLQRCTIMAVMGAGEIKSRKIKKWKQRFI